MFLDSKFKNDISAWKPYELEYMDGMFQNSLVPTPYWFEYLDKNERKIIIDSYHLKKELEQKLNKNNHKEKRIKI
jgi:hypothetical protein